MIKKFIFTFSILVVLSLSNLSAQTPTKAGKITKGIINGAAISLPKPPYPAAAQAVGASGAVNIQVTIDEQGNVIEAKAVSGHPLLRQAAEQAALLAKFKPTTLKGEPVKVSGVIIYNFVSPSVSDLDDEDKKFVWTFGFFLTFLQDAEPSLLKEIGEEKELDDILLDLTKDIPDELSAEKELFQRLANSKNAERQRAAGELNNSLKKYFSGAESVDYEIGQAAGAIVAQILKKSLSLRGKNFQSNEAILKSNLTKLKESLKINSSNIPAETLRQFNDLASFADSTDLSSEESFLQLFQTIEKIFEIFDKEQKEDS